MQTLERKALAETVLEKAKLRLISFGYGKAPESSTTGESVESEEMSAESENVSENVTDESTEVSEDVSYEFTPVEEMILSFNIDKSVREMEMKLNSDIPEAFEYALVDMVVGEFLMSQKSLGTLKMNALDYNMVVKSVQEGDTNITFADGSSDSQKLDVLISYLMHPEIDYADYRKIRW